MFVTRTAPDSTVVQARRANSSCGRALAGVRLLRHSRADVVAFERAVVRLPEVVHTHHVTGNYDRLAGLPGVGNVTSYVTMTTLSTDDR